jgi:hypothetical protein
VFQMVIDRLHLRVDCAAFHCRKFRHDQGGPTKGVGRSQWLRLTGIQV